MPYTLILIQAGLFILACSFASLFFGFALGYLLSAGAKVIIRKINSHQS